MKYRNFKIPRITALLICFLIIFAISAGSSRNLKKTSVASAKNYADYWIEKYGQADPKDPKIKKVYAIFEKVRDAADDKKNRSPKLKIVNSPDDPWAIALPDGNVILSAGAVRNCYRNVSESEGDARMAFVIGHELAHMADDHFWHLEVFAALSGRGMSTESVLEKETKADDQGFLYASLAGYQTDTLLGSKDGKADFFTAWMAQLPHRKTDPAHPSPRKRADVLQSRLKTLSEKIFLFRFGVRLAHFGRYEDARYFLEDFQKVFPSAEVLGNLGYCTLQLAIAEMPPSLSYEFWLPAVMDVRTRAEDIIRGNQRAGQELTQDAKNLLKEAGDYLKKACDADQNYIPSRINLAVIHFYLGENYKARAVIEEAYRLKAADPDIRMLRAIIMMGEAPDADMWPRAEKIIRELSEIPASRIPALYNLAVMYEQRGRTQAGELWKTVAKAPEKLPAPFRAQVERRTPVPAFSPKKIRSEIPPLPVPIGTDLKEDEKSRNIVETWDKLSFDYRMRKLTGTVYSSPSGISLLELYGFAEMIVLSGEALADIPILPCDRPLWENRTASGTVCACAPGISVLKQDNKISEIWLQR